jgi:hypothetical protein
MQTVSPSDLDLSDAFFRGQVEHLKQAFPAIGPTGGMIPSRSSISNSALNEERLAALTPSILLARIIVRSSKSTDFHIFAPVAAVKLGYRRGIALTMALSATVSSRYEKFQLFKWLYVYLNGSRYVKITSIRAIVFQ